MVGACPLPLSFVPKKENEKIPVLDRWASNICTIHFDRESREGNITMIRRALRRLKEGKNLVIFPEGTRSRGDEMVPFKVGSLQVTLMSKVDIVPLTLNSAYCIDVNSKNKTISIHFGEIIKYDDYKNLSGAELEQLVYDKIHERITVF